MNILYVMNMFVIYVMNIYLYVYIYMYIYMYYNIKNFLATNNK
uniref:Uncharacterized protein n=1 Tax=viral metagenome TaxID=1070528 RepID=A0A6C0I9Q9_9ZZZZ